MWVKWLGGAMILSACVVLGRQKGKSLARREAELQSFLQLCHMIETEISFGQTPLPQIFSQSCRRLPLPVGNLAGKTGRLLQARTGDTLSGIWNQVLADFAPQLSLHSDDLAIVKTIGDELGLTYSAEQMKKIQLITLRLEEQEKAAHEERLKMEKVWQVLGWCGGSMLVLLLI